MAVIECVPNVSEGRRPEVIAALAAAIPGPGVRLLDQSSDRSHNRSVFTFAGNPQGVADAVARLFDAAAVHIDISTHEGVHPRIGAVDVVPFVPLRDADMSDCVALARNVAAHVAEAHDVPVFLYEEAAASDARRRLSEIRRGGLAGLALRMRGGAWAPDFGPRRLHPTLGASAIGARPVLIAYNVNLASDRLGVARRIAGRLRESSGGLAYVKALGVPLEERGIVQVTMNLTNYRETSMTTVFDAIVRAAADDGVRVLESEIVGLVPADALPPDPGRRLKLRPEDLGKTIEARLDAQG